MLITSACGNGSGDCCSVWNKRAASADMLNDAKFEIFDLESKLFDDVKILWG